MRGGGGDGDEIQGGICGGGWTGDCRDGLGTLGGGSTGSGERGHGDAGDGGTMGGAGGGIAGGVAGGWVGGDGHVANRLVSPASWKFCAVHIGRRIVHGVQATCMARATTVCEGACMGCTRSKSPCDQAR
eukprot:1184866-Prymnesium_polylepis.1